MYAVVYKFERKEEKGSVKTLSQSFASYNAAEKGTKRLLKRKNQTGSDCQAKIVRVNEIAMRDFLTAA